MTTFIVRTEIGLALIILAIGVTGCAKYSEKQAEASQAGAPMQQSGIMSQNDYIRVRELGHQTSQTHTMSDADLDWTVALVRKSGSSVARARALTTLSEIRPMSAAQKSKILPAINPYLNSTNRLDQAGAQRVQRAIDARG